MQFVTLGTAAILAVCLIGELCDRLVRRPRRRTEAVRTAYRRGREWCLRVHALPPDDADRAAFTGYTPVVSNGPAAAWERGYLDALAARSLPPETDDLRAMRHNRYADAERNALTTALAGSVCRAMMAGAAMIAVAIRLTALF